MNEKTLVSVQCYLGDVGRVLNNMASYLHHHPAPVVIMSPKDSQVNIPGLICRELDGNQAYIGEESLARQRSCLKTLLEYPFEFYLLNDSDSVCISPEIPRYLYADREVFWSNELPDPRTHPTELPRLAFQAPYFFSRDVLKKLVAVCDDVKANPVTPYIDHFMLQLVYAADVRHKSFTSMESPHGSCFHCSESATWEDMQSERIKNHRRVMLHQVKTLGAISQWREDYILRHER